MTDKQFARRHYWVFVEWCARNSMTGSTSNAESVKAFRKHVREVASKVTGVEFNRKVQKPKIIGATKPTTPPPSVNHIKVDYSLPERTPVYGVYGD